MRIKQPFAASEQETEQENPPEQEALEAGDEDKMPNEIPEDLLLEAVLAALPPDILAKLSKGTNKKLSGSGSGTKTKGNRRGRPLPALAAKPNSDQRIDLFATLRAAALGRPFVVLNLAKPAFTFGYLTG